MVKDHYSENKKCLLIAIGFKYNLHMIIIYIDRGYSGYLPMEIIEAGLKTGKYIQGHMNVNRSNASEEAFVRRKR
jgi:hypothetical protein